jgi:hypothetical protein
MTDAVATVDAMIAEVDAEIAGAEARRTVLVEIRRRLSGGEPVRYRSGRLRPRRGVKIFVLDRLTAGPTNAAMIVSEMPELSRGTVSSLLSRLKNEGVAAYDGEFYRLASAPAPTAEMDR